MQITTWLRRGCWPLALVAAVSANGTLRADDEVVKDEKAPPAKEAQADKPAVEEKVEKKIVVRRGKGPSYRIGLHLAPLSPALNEQLDLKGEGMVVAHVIPDGPADKAGIKRNDILIIVGDKPVTRVEDLLIAENGSEGKELSFKLLRGGKPITVTVAPKKEEGDVIVRRKGVDLDWNVDVEEIEKMIKDKLKQAGADVRLEFFKPGRIFPPGFGFKAPEFPDDLTVNIHKEGKNPASVEVKRGDKTWNVKEDGLDELPDDIRPHVEALLGHGPLPFTVRWDGRGPDGPAPPGGPGHPPGPPHVEFDGPGPRPDGPPPGGPDGPRAGGPRRRGPDGPPPPGGPDGPRARRPGGPQEGPDGPPPGEREGRRGLDERMRGGLERRLEEMTRRMQEMRHQMDELRESLRREFREQRDDDKDE